jgi:hypothetical protein
MCKWMMFLSLALIPRLVLAQPMPNPPDSIPDQWLAPEQHPRLFVFPEGLESARQIVRDTAWGQAYLTRQQAICAPLLDMSDDDLRALVPPPGSLFVYGLGFNLDPVKQQRLLWGGWKDPHHVRATDGTVYPNDDWPDAGEGAVDPQTNKRYYFVANANGFIAKELEFRVLPALADVAALTGSPRHAHVAAVLFDAVAAVYPTNRRGPLDYPTSPSHFDRGGRLNRPYYQTARGLINFGHAVDLIASTGAFNQPSAYTDTTIREHVIRNLLWDGGTYCLEYAHEGYQLHNGHADYMQGAAVVGVLLDRRDFCDVMIDGPLSLKAMLDINIDRNGYYYETSPGYANHARQLYVHLAELLEAMRRLGWRDVPSAYHHPAMRMFLTDPFDRQEVGGHIPLIGDAGPDMHTYSPLRRRPELPRVYQDSFIDGQLIAAWIRMARGVNPAAAAQLLVDSYGAESPTPEGDRWSIYHVSPSMMDDLAGREPDREHFETDSTLYGAKGLALLRGGEGEQRYGAQLFFGPLHNHAQHEGLTWTFFARGGAWGYDPGYYNKHYRMGWTTQTVAHQAMVVDQTSHAMDGGTGRLLAWHAGDDVQYAMGAHEGVYHDHKNPVSRFERLIGQVRNPATGDVAYWLDVSIVEGGEQRDDSFHSRMIDAEFDIELQPTGKPAMFGEQDLGRMITNGLYLEGADESDFYYVAPGEGYGFLGSPRSAAMDRNVRVVMRTPQWREELDLVLIADLLGAPGREMIVADGPQISSAKSVPYIIRRDSGSDVSVFGKVVRLVDHADADPIASVEQRGDTFTVTWTDGRTDRWQVNEQRVALTRFDAQGKRVAEQVSPRAPPSGQVIAVSADGAPATLTVRWDRATDVQVGMPLVTTPPIGQPATWRVAAVDGNRIELEDAMLSMARTDLIPADGEAGWFDLASGISRFFSGGSIINSQYALGKAVYDGDTFVGRIAEISDDGRRIRLEGAGVTAHDATFTARILEVAQGDRVTIVR